MPKQGTELGAVIFRDNSLSTFVALCDFVAYKLGRELSPLVVIFTLEVLDKMFTRGKPYKKKGNPYGCKGKPK